MEEAEEEEEKVEEDDEKICVNYCFSFSFLIDDLLSTEKVGSANILRCENIRCVRRI